MTRVAVLVFVLVLAPGVRAATAQIQPVEWKDAEEVGSDDRKAILRLAQRLGIDEPRRVEVVSMTSCPYVLVESAATTEGMRHAWRDLRLHRRDWRRCERERPASIGEGRWVGSLAELYEHESWRISDGAWSIDVHLGDGVPYADAERIVQAIRRRTLVRVAQHIGPLTFDTIPALNADDIQAISRRDAPGSYEVKLGKRAGEVLWVVLAGDTVELHSVGTWIARNDQGEAVVGAHVAASSAFQSAAAPSSERTSIGSS